MIQVIFGGFLSHDGVPPSSHPFRTMGFFPVHKNHPATLGDPHDELETPIWKNHHLLVRQINERHGPCSIAMLLVYQRVRNKQWVEHGDIMSWNRIEWEILSLKGMELIEIYGH